MGRAAAAARQFPRRHGAGAAVFPRHLAQRPRLCRRRPHLAVLLLGLGRLAVLAGALALASRQGALPLLLVLAGLLASRALVLRQLAKAPA